MSDLWALGPGPGPWSQVGPWSPELRPGALCLGLGPGYRPWAPSSRPCDHVVSLATMTMTVHHGPSTVDLGPTTKAPGLDRSPGPGALAPCRVSRAWGPGQGPSTRATLDACPGPGQRAWTRGLGPALSGPWPARSGSRECQHQPLIPVCLINVCPGQGPTCQGVCHHAPARALIHGPV
jgi:hypothetical protein